MLLLEKNDQAFIKFTSSVVWHIMLRLNPSDWLNKDKFSNADSFT